MGLVSSPRHSSVRRTLPLLLLALGAFAAPSGADTFYVDNASPACSNSGPGTEAVPYCTIAAAAAAHNGPGVTIRVKPGLYHEAVGAPRSGAPDSFYVVQGEPGVVIDAAGFGQGVSISGPSWIKIDGLKVVNPMYDGIRVGGSHDVIVSHNEVVGAPEYGIYGTNAANLLIAGNVVSNGTSRGIQTRDVTASTIEDNEAFGNNIGINVTGMSAGVLVRRNRVHGNTTSGLALQSGATDVLCLQNLCWSNGEHGILHSSFTARIRHLNSVVWGNGDDGVDIKSTSTDVTLANCILVDNGLGASAYDLNVDSTSMAGFASDDNVIWNSNGQKPIRFGNPTYATVAAFTAATGRDTRTRAADPIFIDALHGNFHVRSGSSAIDCGNSGVTDWPALDMDGHARADDPLTLDAGMGPVGYTDRGAYEFGSGGGTSGVSGSPSAGLRLLPAVPNPMRSGGRFAFVLPSRAWARLSIVDVQGRALATVASGVLSAGHHEVAWDGRLRSGATARPGLYFVKLETRGATASRRFVIER